MLLTLDYICSSPHFLLLHHRRYQPHGVVSYAADHRVGTCTTIQGIIAASPVRIFAEALPVMELFRAFPVPSVALVPVRVRFSTLSASCMILNSGLRLFPLPSLLLHHRRYQPHGVVFLSADHRISICTTIQVSLPPSPVRTFAEALPVMTLSECCRFH